MGADMTDKENLNTRTCALSQRELIVAYLSYALDDVGALSPVGLRLLQMTIASLTGDNPANVATGELPRFLS